MVPESVHGEGEWLGIHQCRTVSIQPGSTPNDSTTNDEHDNGLREQAAVDRVKTSTEDDGHDIAPARDTSSALTIRLVVALVFSHCARRNLEASNLKILTRTISNKAEDMPRERSPGREVECRPPEDRGHDPPRRGPISRRPLASGTKVGPEGPGLDVARARDV